MLVFLCPKTGSNRRRHKNAKEESTMENQKTSPAATLPWYDDRVEAVRKDDDAPVAEAVEEPTHYTPKEIYDYLDRHVWKQDEAKKAASIIMYNALYAIRSTAMFIGPSGCGKTHIWRCLKKLFPSMIDIRDSSCVHCRPAGAVQSASSQGHHRS